MYNCIMNKCKHARHMHCHCEHASNTNQRVSFNSISQTLTQMRAFMYVCMLYVIVSIALDCMFCVGPPRKRDG